MDTIKKIQISNRNLIDISNFYEELGNKIIYNFEF